MHIHTYFNGNIVRMIFLAFMRLRADVNGNIVGMIFLTSFTGNIKS